MTEEQPKIIVDSDWKEQAAREKEKLAAEAAPQQPQGLPPADFVTHCASLATQAMIFVGAIANPMTGKADVDFEQARYVIDILTMLRDKTKGNLEQHEADTIESLVGELKMIWIQAQASGDATK